MRGLLFHDGPIYPMEGPRLRHGVLLTRGNRIEYVGPAGGLAAGSLEGVQRVDLAGRPLLPGFCDSHVHLVLAAVQRQELDLRGLTSVTELTSVVRARAATLAPGEWLVGGGWEKRLLFPDREASTKPLDEAAPGHPVILLSKDLHAAWLSHEALARFLAMPDPPRGCVPQRVGGAFSGIVFESVLDLRQRLVPALPAHLQRRCLGPFARHLWEHGITAVHSIGSVAEHAITREHLAASGERVRTLWSFVLGSPGALRASADLWRDAVPGWLHAGGVKLFVDGTFGSLTAAVTAPYTGTGDLGILSLDATELAAWMEAIRDAGTHGLFHAIGDRAVQLVVEAIDRVAWPEGQFHRIEHAQLLPAALGERPHLGDLVFSVQPSHLWGDRDIISRHLAPSLHPTAYALRTMLARGGTVLFGSDAPVEEVEPFRAIRAAVTRVADDVHAAFLPEQALTMTEAIAAYTSAPRRVHGGSLPVGALRSGLLADLVVLSADPFAMGEGDPWQLRVELTVSDGRIVYTR